MPFLPEDAGKLAAEDFTLKDIEVKKEDRFSNGYVHDKWAALLFIAHLFVTLAYGGGGIAYAKLVVGDSESVGEFGQWDSYNLTICISVAFVSFGIGCLFALFFYLFSLKKPLLLIQVSAFMYAAILLAYGALILTIAIFSGNWVFYMIAVLDAFLIFLLILCLFIMRKTFALTAAYFKTAAQVLGQFKGMIFVLVIGVVVYAVFCLFWVASIIGSTYFGSPIGFCIGGVWLMFSWFWTSQVIVGTLRVCVAGIIGRWYFNDTSSSIGTVFLAFKRAVFHSFGSVCFGTLITASISTMRATLRILMALNRAMRPQNIIMCFVRIFVGCFLACFYVFFLRLSFLLKFFNQYAFTYIAVYGLKFTDAGYATIKMLVTGGIEAILNEANLSIVIMAQTMTICFVSSLCSTGILLCFYYSGGESIMTNELWVIAELLGIFISLGIGMITTDVVNYTIPALLICSADEPEKMPTKCPELYETLKTKYPQLLFLRSVHV